MYEKVESVHLQHFSPFLFFYNFHGKLSILKMLICILFLGGRGSEKVYVLYIHLKVDNYQIQIQIQIILLHYNVLHSQTEFDSSYGNPQ